MSDDHLSMENMLELAMGLSMTSLFQQAMTTAQTNVNQQLNPNYVAAPPRYIFAVIDGAQHGPYSLGEVMEYIRKGIITPKTYIWKQGMPNWLPAEEVEDIRFEATATPPQIP